MVDLVVLPLDKKISYDAAKWLKVQVLLDPSEFSQLLDDAKCFLFDMNEEISLPVAKERYKLYVEALQKGETPASTAFAWMATRTPHSLYRLDTGGSTQIRIREPIVQITHHPMNYTVEDNSFRSNQFGAETIYWGLQFSFPQLFMDPVTKDVIKLNDPALFENIELFRFFQRWMREHSMPTPFEEFNAPQRIGKKAMAWVNNHPHLIKKGLKVKT